MDLGKPAIFVSLLFLLSVTQYITCQNPEKLREDTTVDIADYGEIKTAITTNRTKAYLSCESGDMIVTVDFKEPFFGIIYANRDIQSPCQTVGNGKHVYTIRLPLQGCGTREDPKRVFINDIVVRFRKGLIVDEDEVKTIICRYGPPVAPPILPIVPLEPLVVEPVGIVAKPKKLSEAEIYVIICFLLFLALLLLGVGLAYYCLKKRNIKIVRKRRAISSAPASEITKLSGSTMGTLTAFDGFRIPRATAHSTSGSEAALLTQGDHSDTMPSDYPSESPSSMHSEEETETRRDTTIISESSTIMDDYRYDNRAYTREEALQRFEATPTPPPARSLTTIYEQEDYLSRTEEYDRSVLSARRLLQEQLPPVYAKIRKKQLESVSTHHETTMMSDELEESTRMRFAPAPSLPDNEHRSTSEFEVQQTAWLRPTLIPRVHTTTVSEARSMSEYLEEVTRREPPEPAQHLPNYDEVDSLSIRTAPSEIAEPPAIYRAPTTTRHTIDDLYLTTITEARSHEDVTKHTRQTTHTHVKEPPPPPPKWDVLIRTYPPEVQSHQAPTVTTDSEVDQWENMSYVSERPQSLYGDSNEAPHYPPPPPPKPTASPPNWDVLIRVLKPQAPSEHGTDVDDDDESVDDLSDDDRQRWKKIITTDTTLRTMLQEAHTVEEFNTIRKDQRYEKLFEPNKWDVIIRILSGPPEPSERAISDTSSTISESYAMSVASSNGTSGYPNRRFRKKSDQAADNRSRRSSLPPVYEYEDFDFGGTITPTTRSRRTSRSSEYDLQSEDELRYEAEVDQHEPVDRQRDTRDADSLWSGDQEDALGYLDARRAQARSIAERSTTEIVENVPRVFERVPPSEAARERRSLLRSSSETVESPEMIERDSLDGHGHHYSDRSSRYHHRETEGYYGEEILPREPSSYSPNSTANLSRNQHRLIERSSTEIMVDSPSFRMAGQAVSRDDDDYSLPETGISNYMR